MTKWLDEMVAKSPSARYIAWSGELLFAGAKWDDKQGRVVKFIVRQLPESVGTEHPFAQYTRRRAGHAGTIFEAAFAGVAPLEQEFLIELMLLGWADGPAGQTVTFLMHDDEVHATLMRRVRDQDSWMATLMEKQDDETPVDQPKRSRVERKPQRLSILAAQMIKTELFQNYLMDLFETAPGTRAANGDEAAVAVTDDLLKIRLEIDSKAELDSDPTAAGRFRQLCSSFVEWQKATGQPK